MSGGEPAIPDLPGTRNRRATLSSLSPASSRLAAMEGNAGVQRARANQIARVSTRHKESEYGNHGRDPFPPQCARLQTRGGIPGGSTPDPRSRQRAPSGGNYQHWDFIVVTDRQQLTELATVWQGAQFIASAPAAIALVMPHPVNPDALNTDDTTSGRRPTR